MRIGTMFFGKVDALANESIQTKFFVFGVPVMPLTSYYVLAEDAGGVKGFEIPLSGKSVTFGYLRFASWIGALVFGVFANVERHDTAGLWAMAVVCLAVALASTFFLGKLSGQEKLRRTVLKALTGVGAPPEFLPVDLVQTTKGRLNEAWEEKNAAKPWKAAIEAGWSDPLLFALAEYDLRDDLAQRAFAAMLQSGDEPKGGPYRT